MSVEADRPPAVIVGFETNALGISRSLHAARVRCLGISGPEWHPAHATSTAQVTRLAEWSEERVIEALVVLGRGLGSWPVLLITKDEPVLWISNHRAALEPLYRLVLPESSVVELLMNKRSFASKAAELRWPVPRGETASSAPELEQAISKLRFPIILKPQLKNSVFRRSCDAKAFVASDAAALLAAYRRIAAWEPEVIVQEFVPGGDERIAFCLSYFGADGEPRAMFAGRKIRQWPIRCGNTAICEPAPVAWRASIVELTEDIFRTVGFRGLGSIEFKIDPRSEKPVIMEPTVGRTNYQSEIAVLNGVNIPLIAYSDLVGDEPAHARRPVPLTRLIDGEGDLRAACAYHACGELCARAWVRERMERHAHMLFRWKDPQPFFAAAYLTGRLAHATRALGRRSRSALGGAWKKWAGAPLTPVSRQ